MCGSRRIIHCYAHWRKIGRNRRAVRLIVRPAAGRVMRRGIRGKMKPIQSRASGDGDFETKCELVFSAARDPKGKTVCECKRDLKIANYGRSQNAGLITHILNSKNAYSAFLGVGVFFFIRPAFFEERRKFLHGIWRRPPNLLTFNEKMVGPPRIELGTSCTPCKRAPRLRYGPKIK